MAAAAWIQCGALLFIVRLGISAENPLPVVVNTWSASFSLATETAWAALDTGSVLHAVEQGCRRCEHLQCDGSVGYGGHPDSTGEVTLDAMIMHGPTHDIGAVGSLRRVKDAISVARAVLEHTEHTLLVGDGATDFAKMMGFVEEPLGTDISDAQHQEWVRAGCQPNFYKGLANDTASCPPYTTAGGGAWGQAADVGAVGGLSGLSWASQANHDTIGMVVVDEHGDMACGTTTNGANHKVAGRVGDSPIPGSGCYVDNDVGGAAATGDGDVMMRFGPAMMAVEKMRSGKHPRDACVEAVTLIARKVPTFQGALVCVNKAGDHGAARHGLDGFQYSYRSPETAGVAHGEAAVVHAAMDLALD